MAILRRVPHDINVLRQLHPILIELSDLLGCADLFKQAFEQYQKIYPAGAAPDNSLSIEGGGFGRHDLLLLADLYNTLGEHEKAVEIIRKGTRWLQGRAEQKYWDLCEDDREYDLPEWAPRSNNGEEDVIGVISGQFPLEINARHRLAVARIKSGDLKEGKACSSFFLHLFHWGLFDSSYTPVLSSLRTSKSSRYCLLRSQMHTLRNTYGRTLNPYMNCLGLIQRYVCALHFI